MLSRPDPIMSVTLPAPTHAIRFSTVGHQYRASDGQPMRALANIDFTIERRQFVVVVGPSGCGKSTLLRLVAGLLKPSEGQVDVFGLAVDSPRDDIGMVFQRPALLPWLDVEANILFPIRHRGQRITAADREEAQATLELVGLADFRKRFPDELSGGMQQRVGIARALLMKPDILLMDEPFSALDALTRDEMSFELLRLWSARQGTVLFITHSITEAILLADRIVVMSPRPGRIREIIDVGLPRPRSPETLRQPLFHDLADRLRGLLMEIRL